MAITIFAKAWGIFAFKQVLPRGGAFDFRLPEDVLGRPAELTESTSPTIRAARSLQLIDAEAARLDAYLGFRQQVDKKQR